MSMGSHRPIWREFIPDDHDERVTNSQYREMIDAYAEIAILEAGCDPEKLSDLIESIDSLPRDAFERLIRHLSSPDIVDLDGNSRRVIWEKLEALVSQHRKFSDAEWAMRTQDVDRIASVSAALKPSDPREIFRRLFSEDEFHLLDGSDDYNLQRERLQEQREDAAREILKLGGIEAVKDFVRSIESPWRFGYALGQIAPPDIDPDIVPPLLTSDAGSLHDLSGSFIASRFRSKGWEWADSIEKSTWTNEERAKFYIYLPFTKEAWTRATEELGDAVSLYWKDARANPYDDEENLVEGTELLIANERGRAAVQLIERLLYLKKTIPAELAVSALEKNLVSSEMSNSFDQHATSEIIEWLQENPDTNQKSLANLEWNYLWLLDRFHKGSPKTLERQLAASPDFFCEVIREVYRSKNTPESDEEPSEQRKWLVENAYKLLREWQTPPGIDADGNVKSDELNRWVESVKKSATESGHFDVAMVHIGHVLAYAPADEDGLWIDRSVAEVLNSQDGEEIRSGLRTELFNQRGVHGFTAGKEERDYAARFKKKADAVEETGFFRLAAEMRRLANTYERQAEEAEKRDPFDD